MQYATWSLEPHLQGFDTTTTEAVIHSGRHDRQGPDTVVLGRYKKLARMSEQSEDTRANTYPKEVFKGQVRRFRIVTMTEPESAI